MITASTNQAFNYLNAKKCANHPSLQAIIICLHPDCWNGPQTNPFLCYKCAMNHFAKVHKGNHDLSISTNMAFTNELYDMITEFEPTLVDIKKKKSDEEDEVSRILKLINEKSAEIESYIKNEFKELRIALQESMRSRENMECASILTRENLEKLQKELSRENNYEKEGKLKEYCINVKELEKRLDDELTNKKTYDDKSECSLNYEITRKKVESLELEIKKTINEKILELKKFLSEKRPKNEACTMTSMGLAFSDGNSGLK